MQNDIKRYEDLSDEQIAYIKGSRILQTAVWRITYPDPLTAIHHKVSAFILREAVILLINIREKFQKIRMKMALQKWLKICKKFRTNYEKRRVLLKLIVLAKDARIKAIKQKYFLRWKNMPNVSERDILEKYGAIFKISEYVVRRTLYPMKKKFFEKIRRIRNPLLYRAPAKKLFRIYEKGQNDLLRKVLIEWRNRAYKLANKDLKRRVLRLAVTSAINRAQDQAKLKALKKWYEATIDREKKGYTLYLIYKKWIRYNYGNLLHSALLKWRLATFKPNDMKQRILKAKEHMLKHNINENAEDLLDALKSVHDYNKRINLLKKILLEKQKKMNDLLRKYLKKWNDIAQKLKNLDILRGIRLKH